MQDELEMADAVISGAEIARKKRDNNFYAVQQVPSKVNTDDWRSLRSKDSINSHESMLQMKDKRREAKLRKLKERQFDEFSLHQLFRLFDRSNSHALSLDDFQSGLLAMGYKDASDKTAVSVILDEIDEDKSGNVSEEEFVNYFLMRRMEELEERILKEASKGTNTTMRIIQYGGEKESFYDSDVLEISDTNNLVLAKRLIKTPLSSIINDVKWIDMNGYHYDSMLLISQNYVLHEETIKDAGIYQRQKIEILTPGPSKPTVTAKVTSPITGRRATLINKDERTHVVFVLHKIDCVPPLLDSVWDENGKLRQKPDSVLSMSQYTIYSIGDQITLTVGRDFDKLAAKRNVESEDLNPNTIYSNISELPSLIGSTASTTLGQLRRGESGSIGDTGRDTEGDIFEELRQRIENKEVDLYANTATAKYLTFCAVEAIMEYNYTRRDELKKWLRDIEYSVQNNGGSDCNYHLYQFRKLAAKIALEFRAVGEALTPALKGDHMTPKIKTKSIYRIPRDDNLESSSKGFSETDANANTTTETETKANTRMKSIKAGKTVKFKKAPSMKNVEEDTFDLDFDDEDDLNKDEVIDLGNYFQNEYIFFKDLQDEIFTITTELEEMTDTADSLTKYYTSIQDERTNRSLFILTLVTSIFVPAQFLTGIYGMNFDKMPELSWNYGYLLFWMLCVLLTLIASITFLKIWRGKVLNF